METAKGLLWIFRQNIYWPAQILYVDIQKQIVFVKFYGDASNVYSAPLSRALPFSDYFEQFSKQSNHPSFLSAVNQAFHTYNMLNPTFSSPSQNLTPQYDADYSTEDYSPHIYSDENRSASSSKFHIHSISIGQNIKIKNSSEIHIKLQYYANTEAIVIDVPVHPNTWFGVRLFDGKCVKIRKSAFDVISSGESSESSHLPLSNDSFSNLNLQPDKEIENESIRINSPTLPESDSRGDDHEIETIMPDQDQNTPIDSLNKSDIPDAIAAARHRHQLHKFFEEEPKFKKAKFKSENKNPKRTSPSYSLNLIKGENWIDRKVLIISGKYAGKIGTVRRSGHGFYCVDVKGFGEVMKRAAELDYHHVISHDETDENAKQFYSDPYVQEAASILVKMMHTKKKFYNQPTFFNIPSVPIPSFAPALIPHYANVITPASSIPTSAYAATFPEPIYESIDIEDSIKPNPSPPLTPDINDIAEPSLPSSSFPKAFKLSPASPAPRASPKIYAQAPTVKSKEEFNNEGDQSTRSFIEA